MGFNTLTAGRVAVGDFVSDCVPGPVHIEEQLAAVLASPAFRGSSRCSQFLKFICERALAGESASLKERTIAVAVYGRHPGADLSEDTIVRVGAREVRKRLAQFYVSAEGVSAPVVIALAPGSYAPEFRYAQPPAAAHSPSPAMAAGTVWPLRWRSRWVVSALLLAFAFTVVAVVGKSSVTGSHEPFLTFWQPLFGMKPVVLAVDTKSRRSPGETSERGAPPSVDFGELVASAEVSELFGRYSKPLSIRTVDSLGATELEHSNLVLIGYSGLNDMGQLWRFRMERDPDQTPVLVDSASAARRFRTEPAVEASLPVNDYVLISRVRDTETSTWVIATAGLHARGTEYGGRLLGDPERLASLLRKLPPEWAVRNLQMVLRERSGGPADGRPELVAWHIW